MDTIMNELMIDKKEFDMGTDIFKVYQSSIYLPGHGPPDFDHIFAEYADAIRKEADNNLESLIKMKGENRHYLDFTEYERIALMDDADMHAVRHKPQAELLNYLLHFRYSFVLNRDFKNSPSEKVW